MSLPHSLPTPSRVIDIKFDFTVSLQFIPPQMVTRLKNMHAKTYFLNSNLNYDESL